MIAMSMGKKTYGNKMSRDKKMMGSKMKYGHGGGASQNSVNSAMKNKKRVEKMSGGIMGFNTGPV